MPDVSPQHCGCGVRKLALLLALENRVSHRDLCASRPLFPQVGFPLLRDSLCALQLCLETDRTAMRALHFYRCRRPAGRGGSSRRGARSCSGGSLLKLLWRTRLLRSPALKSQTRLYGTCKGVMRLAGQRLIHMSAMKQPVSNIRRAAGNGRDEMIRCARQGQHSDTIPEGCGDSLNVHYGSCLLCGGSSPTRLYLLS